MSPFRTATVSKPAWRLSLSLALTIALRTGVLADTSPVVLVTVNGTASANVFRGMPVGRTAGASGN